MRTSDFTDDSSQALGLTHAVTGEPLDEKGRRIVTLPPPADGYDPEMVGKTPDEMLAILRAREERRESNADIDRMMREVPGGSPDASHRRSGGNSGRRRKKQPPRFDRVKQNIVEMELADLRPCTIAAKVSVEARAGIYAEGNPSFGTMADLLGRVLIRTSWRAIECALRAVASA